MGSGLVLLLSTVFTHRLCPSHRVGDLLQNRALHQSVLVLLPEHWGLPACHPRSGHAHLEHSTSKGGLHGSPCDCHQPLTDCTLPPGA